MKRNLLIFTAVLSLAAAAYAGYLYWDALLVGMLAVALWTKKLLTLKGLWLLAKKLPLVLLLGLKRLVIKVTSHFLLFTAHLRFHFVRRAMRQMRARAWLVKRRLKYHWQELSGTEQVLSVVAALPLVLLLLLIMVVFVLPKAMISLLLNKTKEHTGAVVLKKTAQLGVKDKLIHAEERIKEKIRQKLKEAQARKAGADVNEQKEPEDSG